MQMSIFAGEKNMPHQNCKRKTSMNEYLLLNYFLNYLEYTKFAFYFNFFLPPQIFQKEKLFFHNFLPLNFFFDCSK